MGHDRGAPFDRLRVTVERRAAGRQLLATKGELSGIDVCRFLVRAAGARERRIVRMLNTVTTGDWAGSRAREHRRLRAPSKLLWLTEYRSIWEFGFALTAAPLLMTAPRGDGHPVLVLPGFLVSDISTTALRNYLNLLGYDAYGWELGRNYGGIKKN